jgi:hypothetical protein
MAFGASLLGKRYVPGPFSYAPLNTHVDGMLMECKMGSLLAKYSTSALSSVCHSLAEVHVDEAHTSRVQKPAYAATLC